MGYKRTLHQPLACPFQSDQHCRNCDCRKRCFFNFLSPESLKKFRKERRMQRYRANQIIFNEGESPQGIFILCVGDVKLSKSDSRGRELTLQYLSCGDLLGEVPFVAGEPYCSSAEAMRDSVVCFLHRNLVEYIYKNEPEFATKLLRKMSRTLCHAMDRAFSFAFRSAQARLAHFLLALKPSQVHAVTAPCHAQANYTRREIAENLGLSPETVIRMLSSFQKRGLIRLSGKTIQVCDTEKLQAVVSER